MTARAAGSDTSEQPTVQVTRRASHKTCKSIQSSSVLRYLAPSCGFQHATVRPKSDVLVELDAVVVFYTQTYLSFRPYILMPRICTSISSILYSIPRRRC